SLADALSALSEGKHDDPAGQQPKDPNGQGEPNDLNDPGDPGDPGELNDPGDPDDDAGGHDGGPDPDMPHALAAESGDAAPVWALDDDDPATPAGSASRRLASRRPRRPSGSARFGVKASMIIGMLLLVPAIWAVCLFAGVDVPNASAANAERMALLMLFCWPVSLALIGGSVYFNRQLTSQQAAYDQAVAAESIPTAGEQTDDDDTHRDNTHSDDTHRDNTHSDDTHRDDDNPHAGT
ncbi:MAG: hypothetical protein KGY81_10265, partial [Phycisphaerae bacterium]|nr:hypothetical protein [Phycisphaerae bacterium]